MEHKDTRSEMIMIMSLTKGPEGFYTIELT